MVDKRLYRKISEEILAMIDEGKYPPGSRLPAERELAEIFGVSRVTVREAQIALQAVKAIEVRTGSGAHVLDRQAKLDALPQMDAFELTQARSAFESEAAALAAVEITEEQLERLKALVERMAVDDAHAHGDEPLDEDADREFHLTIARSTNNRAVVDTIERLWRLRTEIPEIKAAYDSICGRQADERAQEHHDILDALRARDPKQARSAMRQHFSAIFEAMVDTRERDAIAEVKRRASESRERFLTKGALAH